tara:strand:- start:2023 stop:2226 length:204 start_codon:yes stop_codon:yes gene_type:complete
LILKIVEIKIPKVIGSALSDNLTTEGTIVKAWEMATKNTVLEQPLIFHSDRGVQYASHTSSFFKLYG